MLIGCKSKKTEVTGAHLCSSTVGAAEELANAGEGGLTAGRGAGRA